MRGDDDGVFKATMVRLRRSTECVRGNEQGVSYLPDQEGLIKSNSKHPKGVSEGVRSSPVNVQPFTTTWRSPCMYDKNRRNGGCVSGKMVWLN